MKARLQHNKIIFSDWFRERRFPVRYLDVGAREDLLSPWKFVAPSNLRVIGFEPDPEEFERLRRVYPDRRYYPFALWSKRGRRTLYLNRVPSTSSLYPCDEELGRLFDDKHVVGRDLVKTVEVECVPLDDVLEPQDLPHYVKIDTQGAEYEIIRGGAATLQKRAMFLSAETWTMGIYRDAPPFHAVAATMWDLGFQLIDSDIAAAWHYRTHADRDEPLYGRPVLTGLELLFCRRIDLLDESSFGSADDFVVHMAIAELFGFRNYALHLLERFGAIVPASDQRHLTSALVRNSRADRSFLQRLSTAVGTFRGRPRGPFAPLR